MSNVVRIEHTTRRPAIRAESTRHVESVRNHGKPAREFDTGFPLTFIRADDRAHLNTDRSSVVVPLLLRTENVLPRSAFSVGGGGGERSDYSCARWGRRPLRLAPSVVGKDRPVYGLPATEVIRKDAGGPVFSGGFGIGSFRGR